MLKLYFYFLQIVLNIRKFGKSGMDESSGEQRKPTNLILAILRHCQDFLRKLPKSGHIRNACIV